MSGARLPILNLLKRLTRIIGLLLLLGLLPACSAVKIFYNQAPDFAYWTLDGYVDFTEAQSGQVKSELSRLQAWHRQTELPGYIELLQKLQQQLPSDISASAACTVFEDVRGKLTAVSDRAEPAVAALVGTLSASQLAQMQRQFDKGNANYRSDFLEGTPSERRERRLKQAISRAEKLYGSLEDKQLAVIALQIDQSRFDPALAYAEKLRRQQDALQTLRPLIAGQASVEKIRVAMHGLFARNLDSPDPAYRDHQDKLTRQACQSLAAVHNSTTAAQRGQAVETLKGYEHDLRALNAQQP